MGTRYQGTPKERRALDAYIKLSRASESLMARLSAKLAAHDLTMSQFGVLEVLYHLGPLCQRDLGKKLLKSGGNITLVIDNLERRGLVERIRDRRDRRYVSVHLTEAGRALIEKVLPAHVAAIVEELSVLSPREQEALGALCKRVGLGQEADSAGEDRGRSRAR